MKSISDRLAGTAVAGAIDAHAQDAVPDRPVLTRAFSLPAVGARELRLDLFRGLALWLIFIDHVSPDLLSWFTIRSYGFSDAAEIFIFISGYTAAFVYGRSLLESGFVIAAARILRRVWQIYAAHILLFTIMVAEVSYVAISLDKPFYAEEVAITDFFRQPGMAMVQALLLRYRPLNMDVLPLYIVLMAFLPLILALTVIAVRFVPAGWPGLNSPWLRPMILCGQNSLEIFCLGVALGFTGYFILMELSAGLVLHVLVGICGILIMSAGAWMLSWSKRNLDKGGSRPKGTGGNAGMARGG